MKNRILGVLLASAPFAVMAADGDFDATTLITGATTTVTGIVTALGAVLTAAAAFYLAKLGWRKFKAAISAV